MEIPRIEAPSTPILGRTVNDLLTTEEAALLVGCSARHIARLCHKGEIRARKIGTDWRIAPGDLAQYTLPPLGRPRVHNPGPQYNAQERHERYVRSRVQARP